MNKSIFVERLDGVQADLTKLLKPMGFHRNGRTFNRSTEVGLVQVINLQSGQFPIGDNRPLPPDLAHFRQNMYGQFTVNLGVHIREIYDCESAAPYPKVIQDYHCSIRNRLGRQNKCKDFWWSLDHSVSIIAADVCPLIINEGLVFLKKFETRQAIIQDWIAISGKWRLSARARMDVAIILARQGKANEAKRLLLIHMEDAKSRGNLKGAGLEGHLRYVREVARKLDLGEF